MDIKKIFIIAEAGVNHNGSFQNAIELIDAARESGVDAVKFQTFKPEEMVSRNAKKADYQNETTGSRESQLDMLRKLALTYDEFIRLKEHCDKTGIMFLSTPFDNDSIDFLNHINVPIWKVPSGEVTNVPYLIKIAQTKKTIIMSTGICELHEIDFALKLLIDNGAQDIILLHCNTEYPTPMEDVNLKAMLTLSNTFRLPVGYSDHTLGIEVPIAAAALGACVIEKHFTLDKNLEGPDHKASLDPEELREMVTAIRNIEAALGNELKKPTESELKNKDIVRKSIVARHKINAGEVFTEENITVKRPGNGISPAKWFDILGQKAKWDFEKDELIRV